MDEIWMEEPVGEEFECKVKVDEEEKEVNKEAKAMVKQISRRLSMALIVKWLSEHGKEPHKQGEISESLKLNQGTVSFN
jgi:hypothetical protein